MTIKEQKKPRARKEHQCWACGWPITKGMVYLRTYYGAGVVTCQHLGCAAAWEASEKYGEGKEFWHAMESLGCLDVQEVTAGLDEVETARVCRFTKGA